MTPAVEKFVFAYQPSREGPIQLPFPTDPTSVLHLQPSEGIEAATLVPEAPRPAAHRPDQRSASVTNAIQCPNSPKSGFLRKLLVMQTICFGVAKPLFFGV